jgi:hypothetical protein
MAFPGGVASISDAFDGRPLISLRLNVSETQVSGTNRSTISWSLQLVETSSQPSYATDLTSVASLIFSLGSGVTLYDGDNTPTIAKYGYDFRPTGLQTKTIGSGSFVVTHTASGAGTITATASANAQGNIGKASISATTWTLIDFDTTPNTPSAPSVSISNNNSTFNVSVTNPGTANGGPATSVYFQVYNATTGVWDTTNRIPGSISLTNTNKYRFRSVAINSQATEYSSNTSEYPGVPNAPSIQLVSKNAKRVSLTWSPGSTNGSTVSGYRVEGSYDNFSTIHYSANISGSATLSHTTTDLVIAQTYKFRVVTIGSAGFSVASSQTSGLFISAYGYRYNGSNFSTAIQSAKIFVGIGGPGADAYGWRTVQGVKRWNGTSWIDLQT